MECQQCKKMISASMITIGTCRLCGQKCFTPHYPPYVVCEECAIEKNLCQQCGKEIEKDD